MCENRKLHQVWRDHPSMFMYQMPLLSHHVSKRPCDKNPQQENLFKLTPLVLVFFFFFTIFQAVRGWSSLSEFRQIGRGGAKLSGISVFTPLSTISGNTSHGSINRSHTHNSDRNTLLCLPSAAAGWDPWAQFRTLPQNNSNYSHVWQVYPEKIMSGCSWYRENRVALFHFFQASSQRGFCYSVSQYEIMDWLLPWSFLPDWGAAAGFLWPQSSTVTIAFNAVLW